MSTVTELACCEPRRHRAAYSGSRGRPVFGDPGRDGAAVHVDRAVELRSFHHRDQPALRLPSTVDDGPSSMRSLAESRRGRLRGPAPVRPGRPPRRGRRLDGDRGVARRHESLHGAFDGEVVIARHFTVDDEMASDGGHAAAENGVTRIARGYLNAWNAVQARQVVSTRRIASAAEVHVGRQDQRQHDAGVDDVPLVPAGTSDRLLVGRHRLIRQADQLFL